MKTVIQIYSNGIPSDGRVLIAPNPEVMASMLAEYVSGLPAGATWVEVADEAQLVIPVIEGPLETF